MTAALALLMLLAGPADAGLVGRYDPANPFARILRHEAPAAIVYRDRWTLAFLPLAALSPGHVLVVPRRPARTLFDMAPADWAHVMATVRRVAAAQVAALGATGIQLRQNNGADGGQAVFHLHVHVIPRYPGVPLLNEGGTPEPLAAREAMAARLRAAIGN